MKRRDKDIIVHMLKYESGFLYLAIMLDFFWPVLAKQLTRLDLG